MKQNIEEIRTNWNSFYMYINFLNSVNIMAFQLLSILNILTLFVNIKIFIIL